MPVVDHPMPIASVVGEPRDDFGRHTFLGGNFFMLRMLNRNRTALGVAALPLSSTRRGRDRSAAPVGDGRRVDRTSRSTPAAGCDSCLRHEQDRPQAADGLSIAACLAYTSRSTTVRSGWSSSPGRSMHAGAIAGNDQDEDPLRVEPHYDEIDTPSRCRFTSR